MAIVKNIILTLTFLALIAYFITNIFQKKDQIKKILLIIIVVCFFITSFFVIYDSSSWIWGLIVKKYNLSNVHNVITDFLEKNVYNPITFAAQIVSTFFDGYAYITSRNEDKKRIKDFKLFFDKISIVSGTEVTDELINVTFRCLGIKALIPSDCSINPSKLVLTIPLDETYYKEPTYKTKFKGEYSWLLFRRISIPMDFITKDNFKNVGENISFEFVTQINKSFIYDVLNKGDTYYSDVDMITLEMKYAITKKVNFISNIVSDEKSLFANYKRSPTEENIFLYD